MVKHELLMRRNLAVFRYVDNVNLRQTGKERTRFSDESDRTAFQRFKLVKIERFTHEQVLYFRNSENRQTRYINTCDHACL